jgi:hypothetical protein
MNKNIFLMIRRNQPLKRKKFHFLQIQFYSLNQYFKNNEKVNIKQNCLNDEKI